MNFDLINLLDEELIGPNVSLLLYKKWMLIHSAKTSVSSTSITYRLRELIRGRPIRPLPPVSRIIGKSSTGSRAGSCSLSVNSASEMRQKSLRVPRSWWTNMPSTLPIRLALVAKSSYSMKSPIPMTVRHGVSLTSLVYSVQDLAIKFQRERTHVSVKANFLHHWKKVLPKWSTFGLL